MSKPAKKLKAVPTFHSDEEAGAFWMSHDTAEYFDLSKAQPVRFAKLRPSTTTISLRLPQAMLEELRVLANERDVLLDVDRRGEGGYTALHWAVRSGSVPCCQAISGDGGIKPQHKGQKPKHTPFHFAPPPSPSSGSSTMGVLR